MILRLKPEPNQRRGPTGDGGNEAAGFTAIADERLAGAGRAKLKL